MIALAVHVVILVMSNSSITSCVGITQGPVRCVLSAFGVFLQLVSCGSLVFPIVVVEIAQQVDATVCDKV